MNQPTHRTANGKPVSIERIRLENESTIAVGNMRVNARGDSLGPGGTPQSTRQQTVNEYYHLHTPVAGGAHQVNHIEADHQVDKSDPMMQPADPLIEEQDALTPEPTVEPIPHSIPAPAGTKPVRGSLANAMAKGASINQELLKTPKQQVKAQGPSRI